MAYTTIDDPEAYFQVKTYTGTGSSNALTLDGDTDMQPDMVWIKSRSHARIHTITDAVRGVTEEIYPDLADAEDTQAEGLTAFGSDGFTVGTHINYNNDTYTYVAWCWKANGSGSSNSNGSITSTVSASTDAGFSIVSWSGSGANATIGHGLGAEPKIIFLKIRTAGNNWQVYNKSIGSGNALYLNTTDASESNTGWQSTDATSSVFSVSDGTAVNGSGASLIAYCFADVQGFSKVGSYVGNGSSSDGTFVYTGFRPAFVLTKGSSAAGLNWLLMDNKRHSVAPASGGTNFNVIDRQLMPNLSNADDTNENIDFLSNGFKWYRDGGDSNYDGRTYVYMAFAEAPFVNSNGVPCNAR